MNRWSLLQIKPPTFFLFSWCVLALLLFSLKVVALPVAKKSFQTNDQIKIAFLATGESSQKFAAQFAQVFKQQKDSRLVDADQAAAAARGLGYANLFNLSLDEAKNLGIAIDCDFFFITKSETLRRSSFAKNVYFESYAVIFLVSARSGQLITWKQTHFEAATPESAENSLLADSSQIAGEFAQKLFAAAAIERKVREQQTVQSALEFAALPDEETAAKSNYRMPLPYQSLRPAYTNAARQLDVEATVDVAADLNEQGEVVKTEIVRWAGFDLDQESTACVRKMHFRPALQNGKPLAVRILLRYNFRDLSRKDADQ